MNSAVLIAAAGTSERFGKKKEYLSFPERQNASIISQSVYVFASLALFSRILITAPPNHIEKVNRLLSTDHLLQDLLKSVSVQITVIEGSDARQKSVHTGLEYLYSELNASLPDYILVHDGARPWVSENLIRTVLNEVKRYGAVVPAVTPIDTQKEIDDNGKIIRHLTREKIAAIQTPQAFLFSSLLEAHRCAQNDGQQYTDDSEIYAAYRKPVYICCGERKNKKITYPEDLEY